MSLLNVLLRGRWEDFGAQAGKSHLAQGLACTISCISASTNHASVSTQKHSHGDSGEGHTQWAKMSPHTVDTSTSVRKTMGWGVGGGIFLVSWLQQQTNTWEGNGDMKIGSSLPGGILVH